MGQYTDIFYEVAEIARQERHAEQTASLWGKEPDPPRAPVKMLDLDFAWYALYSSHNLADEAGNTTRQRTLDFFIAERPALTEEVGLNISSVVLDNKRYAIATDPRHEVGDPFYWRIICVPTGEILT